MKDIFDKTMERFMFPMANFKGPVMDSTYFLRNDGSFVFSEGYCHSADSFWGMIIKYPLADGHIPFAQPFRMGEGHLALFSLLHDFLGLAFQRQTRLLPKVLLLGVGSAVVPA